MFKMRFHINSIGADGVHAYSCLAESEQDASEQFSMAFPEQIIVDGPHEVPRIVIVDQDLFCEADVK